ncbi:hypothetical protein CFOL_v3_25632, partial [Cephalotus follicularis]
ESPFSNYFSNPSPIKPLKAPQVAHGFLGLVSPALTFTSPGIHSLRESNLSKRLEVPSIYNLNNSGCKNVYGRKEGEQLH